MGIGDWGLEIRDSGDHVARRGLELLLQVHYCRIQRVLRDRSGSSFSENNFRIPGAGFSGFRFRIFLDHLRVPGSALGASGVGCRVLGFGFRFPGAGETFSAMRAAMLASTSAIRFSSGSFTLHPTPYTLHPTPHPIPYTRNPTPHNLRPAHQTPTHQSMNPKPHTLNPSPECGPTKRQRVSGIRIGSSGKVIGGQTFSALPAATSALSSAMCFSRGSVAMSSSVS